MMDSSDIARQLLPLSHKDVLTVAELSLAELGALFDTARRTKADVAPYSRLLAGKSVILIFEKPSLRTRITFEVGTARLGGTAIYADHQGNHLGARESIRDYGKNLERWVSAIVARVFKHQTIAELARHTAVPVINGLSDLDHPCQALADFMTLMERFGTLKNLKLAYVGDGNNVCHSLMAAGAKLGVDVTVVSPPGYMPPEQITAEASALAAESGAKITVTSDLKAVKGHHAVYTDTWVSMGQETERDERLMTFAKYQVNRELMDRAHKDAVFMHCLPAKRGVEVTDEVMDSPRSLVYDQAENRLHVQTAILLHTIIARGRSR